MDGPSTISGKWIFLHLLHLYVEMFSCIYSFFHFMFHFLNLFSLSDGDAEVGDMIQIQSILKVVKIQAMKQLVKSSEKNLCITVY